MTEPNTAPPARVATKKVLVLSYLNTPNFGDRLGYHIVNSLLPAHAVVTHSSFSPFAPPEEDFDLLILGTGMSLNAPAIRRPELHRLIERTPKTLGIFGTQYRYQYDRNMDPALFDALLDKLTFWWARYRSDIDEFAGTRDNVRHLGDWLISAFPLATPTKDKTLAIQADIMKRELPLDRMIQQIQEYRVVKTSRIHPMLCALTSAERILYVEQRETAEKDQPSGKFSAQLRDVFGRDFPENQFFDVDRQAVIRYKMAVDANMADLREQIARLLA